MREETGRNVELQRDYLSAVEEWRNDLHQISCCYRARLVDNSGVPELTDDEVVDGLQHP